MAANQHVVIKGVKDGLVFILDDSCSFTLLLQELRHKLKHTHQKILTGPTIHVNVKLGTRILNEADQADIREIITSKGNLIVRSIYNEHPPQEEERDETTPIKIFRGMVRSGQTLRHDGHLMILGDVNPGGSVLCTGDIYIMGSLRGMAHAGFEGLVTSIVVASLLRPTQLRIADIVSRPPDEWGIEEAVMEFAYIREGSMEIDKINQLIRVRPDLL